MSKAQAAVIAELRLEIEAHRKNIRDARDTISRLKAERRTIAERQREACAKRLAAHIQSGGHEACATVSETPLVTEET